MRHDKRYQTGQTDRCAASSPSGYKDTAAAAQKKSPFIHQSSTTIADNIPASFSTAILFPDAAMRVSRVALPESVLPRFEKCSA
jgi:hypothetical protein